MMMTMMNTLAASPSTGKLRGNVCNGVWAYQTNGLKAKIHYTSFPVASLQQVGDFPITSTQQVRNIKDKSVTRWHGESLLCLLCHVVSQITLQRLVTDFLVCQQVRNNLSTFLSTGKLRGNVHNEFWA